MPNERDDEGVIRQILEARRLTNEELGNLVAAARQAGGSFGGVSWEDGDGICPEWKFPWPPKADGLIGFFQAAWKAKVGIKVFPRGIINPDALHIRVGGAGRAV